MKKQRKNSIISSNFCNILPGYALGFFPENEPFFSMNNRENSNVPSWFLQHFASLPSSNFAQKIAQICNEKHKKPGFSPHFSQHFDRVLPRNFVQKMLAFAMKTTKNPGFPPHFLPDFDRVPPTHFPRKILHFSAKNTAIAKFSNPKP